MGQPRLAGVGINKQGLTMTEIEVCQVQHFLGLMWPLVTGLLCGTVGVILCRRGHPRSQREMVRIQIQSLLLGLLLSLQLLFLCLFVTSLMEDMDGREIHSQNNEVGDATKED